MVTYQKFEQNFQDFIPFLFEKLSNVGNYKNIKENIKSNPKKIIKELINSSLLQNILNGNSKIEIDKLIKECKKEMIEIKEKNYDIFTREQE